MRGPAEAPLECANKEIRKRRYDSAHPAAAVVTCESRAICRSVSAAAAAGSINGIVMRTDQNELRHCFAGTINDGNRRQVLMSNSDFIIRE